MRGKKQTAKPCERKGIGNALASNLCECEAICFKLGGFLKANSKGTKAYNKENNTNFQGCVAVEQLLIEEEELRYYMHEKSGLAVLFNGISPVKNINFELPDDSTDLEFDDEFSTVDEFFLKDKSLIEYELTEDQLIEYYEAEDSETEDESSNSGFELSYLFSTLGYSQSIMSQLFGLGPDDLYDAYLGRALGSGAFEGMSEDFQKAALIIYHHIDDEKDMKSIWPRYTRKRLEKNEKLLGDYISNKMSKTAKKFPEIWAKLTEKQKAVLEMEFYHPWAKEIDQISRAKHLGIKRATYSEHIEASFKKFEKAFPEFERVARRQKKSDTAPQVTISQAGPLYMILESGEKIKISHPKKKDKTLSPGQRLELKKLLRAHLKRRMEGFKNLGVF